MMEDAKSIWVPIPSEKVLGKTGVAAADYARARKIKSDSQGTYSKATNYDDWRSCWKDYYKGGGSAQITSEDVWNRLWNGTYALKDDEGKQQLGDTLRIYNPYIIKLKLKQKAIEKDDLELVGSPDSTNESTEKGSCEAYYRKGYI